MRLEFNGMQISYLRSTDVFKNANQDFFKYLKKFKFKWTVWALPEGTMVFPYEPIARIEAPIVESHIVETFILSMINFQSMISTKASRISIQAKGRPVFEFGPRRAHGPQAAVLAARASYVTNVLAGAPHAIKGSEGAKVVDHLKPARVDYVIPKRTYSSFKRYRFAQIA